MRTEDMVNAISVYMAYATMWVCVLGIVAVVAISAMVICYLFKRKELATAAAKEQS